MDFVELRHFIAEPVAIQLAVAVGGTVPQSVRGFGLQLDADDTLRLGLVDAQAPDFLAALANAQHLAVNLTHPVTFRGRQLKGALLEIEPPSPAAERAALEYFGRFSLLLAKIGLTPLQCRGLFRSGPTRWVRMRPTQQFNQTPGVGAGEPFSP